MNGRPEAPASGVDKRASLAARRRAAQLGGGPDRADAQRKRGKLTARERLAALFDPRSFTELDTFVTHRSTDFGLDQQRYEGDSVVTGFGTVDGRRVFAYAQDFTVLGGSLSEAASLKICKIMDHALRAGAPLVGLNDSGGARIQEGVLSLAGYGEIFKRNVQASGVVPQITVIAGPAAGGAVYSPAITDFIFMVEKIGQMYITGPDVVKAVTGEQVTLEELGGAQMHATRSGVAHFVSSDEKSCYEHVRALLSYLPSNNTESPPAIPPSDDPERRDESLAKLVPDDPSQAYDMHEVIRLIVDNGIILPVHERYAPNIICTFARLDGMPVGIVAQQPAYLAGVLDIDASDKAARFVRFCDAFNVPIVTLVDVPGFMPGTAQEFGGIIRHGAKLIYAYAEATVPKVTVITRKAYGGAYIVMGSKHLRGDVNLAWPSAEIAVMGPDGAVNIIHRAEISEAADQVGRRSELISEYREKFANPYIAAQRGFIDDVIDPADTRPAVIRALRMLETKTDQMPPKKHGNIPL
ncbi:MAG: methylmalonyl-CoA carboxyltransferase [Chloroflexi bacterium]|nr:methylmalonyl-CoA carboxyltransferase [Chloroflexota bacterium]